MQSQSIRPIAGHVYRHEGKRRPVWRARYRVPKPDGSESIVHTTLGPAWKGKDPPEGCYNRHKAEAELRKRMVEAERGNGPVRTRVTFADAAAEWLRHAEFERGVKGSTLREYKSVVNGRLVPAFGGKRLEAVTTREIEA